MKTVLITGFEPFAGGEINPSEEIASELTGRVILGRTVLGGLLPCVFDGTNGAMLRLLRATNPELVIALGQAGGRAEITPERVAINVDDARIADNAGAQPIDAPVIARGPVAYWSTLPIKAIVAALRARKIPSAVSQTAGTFVCNHVFYCLMHALRSQRAVRGGFIHVPLLPEQAGKGQASLRLETMVEAIEIAIEVSLRTKRDLRAEGGTE